MSSKQVDPDELARIMETKLARVPNLFILDRSGSMAGKRIEMVNDGLERFVTEVQGDRQAEWSIDVSVISFGSDITIDQDFRPIDDAWIDGEGNPDTPELQPGGSTPMCEAIIEGLKHLEEYKSALDEKGIARKRALVWLLTDGKPDMDQSPGTTKWDKAQDLIENGTEKGENKNPHMFFFAAAVSDDADLGTLKNLVSVGNEDVVHAFDLKEEMFREYFQVASASAKNSASGGQGADKEDVLPEEAMDQSDSGQV